MASKTKVSEKDKSINELKEVLGEMGFNGDVTSYEARDFWEKNKGNIPQRYIDKYGIDSAQNLISNKFEILGQKTWSSDDSSDNAPKTVTTNNNQTVTVTPKDTWEKANANRVGSDSNPIKPQVPKPQKDFNVDSTTDKQNIKEDVSIEKEVADDLKADEKTYDDMSAFTDKFHQKSSNVDDYYKENLHKTLWQMYKDGELDGTTGDAEKDKAIAKNRLGYYIMNKLGSNLVNASLVARGSSPTQESDLDKMRRVKMEGALDRYNKKRDTIMSETINKLGITEDMLKKYNMSLDELRNNKIFEEVSKSLDRLGQKRMMKVFQEVGQYLGDIPDEQKSNIMLAIMALNSKDAKDAGLTYLGTVFGKPMVDKIAGWFSNNEATVNPNTDN